jgi:hypothetical protein
MSDFLAGEHAHVLKRNATKFTTTFAVFMDYCLCTVKMRLYSDGENLFKLEFQRRNADNMAFLLFYNKVSAFLASRLDSKSPVMHVLRTIDVIENQPSSDAHMQSILQPILDWCYGSYEQRRAAAAFFWRFSDDANNIAHLCQANVINALLSILKRDAQLSNEMSDFAKLNKNSKNLHSFGTQYPVILTLLSMSLNTRGRTFLVSEGCPHRLSLGLQDSIFTEEVVVQKVGEVLAKLSQA